MKCDIKTWFVMPMFLLTMGYFQCCVHGESQVPCLFIFGDSMCDNGNNNFLPTLAKSNFEPYGIDFPKGPTGRFTNGRTTVDIISQFLGFEEFIPPFANTIGSDILKGVNYATAGAGIRLDTSKYSALHEIGARKYVLCGLGLLGCLPYSMITHATNGSCVEEENANAFIFNDKLKSLVDNFNNKFSADSKFMFINGTSEDLQYLHGFPVPNATCCPTLLGGCIPHHRPCYNRSEYQFWDQLHPTEARNLASAIMTYNNASNLSFTYPMDIKHLVDQE